MKFLFGKKSAKNGIDVVGLEKNIFYIPRRKMPISIMCLGNRAAAKWIKATCKLESEAMYIQMVGRGKRFNDKKG